MCIRYVNPENDLGRAGILMASVLFRAAILCTSSPKAKFSLESNRPALVASIPFRAAILCTDRLKTKFFSESGAIVRVSESSSSRSQRRD